MQKLLIVCGPTGTGKTRLGLYLAKKFNGEIISADSRQVYKELNIGTGKDLPAAAQAKDGHYDIDGVKVWGYDLVGPKDQFSVGQFIEFANKLIPKIHMENKLPILVGGTGFYIKGIVDGISTALVPQDESLRQSLAGKSVAELFDMLAQFNPVKAANMNQSDRKNPRRLIRAIEVAQSKEGKVLNFTNQKLDTLFVGLIADMEILTKNVEDRVMQRLAEGVEGEINDLLAMGVTWDNQSMTSMGYVEWKDYFLNNVPKVEVISKWVQDEKNYLKRQVTWFKKEPRINWFKVGTDRKKVENLVKKWYKQD